MRTEDITPGPRHRDASDRKQYLRPRVRALTSSSVRQARREALLDLSSVVGEFNAGASPQWFRVLRSFPDDPTDETSSSGGRGEHVAEAVAHGLGLADVALGRREGG